MNLLVHRGAAFRLLDGNSVRCIIIAEPDYFVSDFYVFAGGNTQAAQVFSSLPVNTGHWQTIDIEYTYGSSDLTLVVDGVSETLASAIRPGITSLSGIRFNHASIGTTYYIDGLPSEPLAGDYNGDGTVDAADYVLWRKDPDSPNNGAPDGYNTWRAHFGVTAGSGAGFGTTAAPEPATCVLGLLGCAFSRSCTAVGSIANWFRRKALRKRTRVLSCRLEFKFCQSFSSTRRMANDRHLETRRIDCGPCSHHCTARPCGANPALRPKRRLALR